jgi:hypothetical protein
MARSQSSGVDEPDALTVNDLRKLLPASLGRTAAYQIARKLGVRVGRRRLLVSRARFDQWLAGEQAGGA